jgi:hypothetical protein
MKALARGVVPFLLVVLLPVPVRAEEPHYRLHPEFATRMRAVKTIAVIRPTMRLYELTAGGGRTLKPDWSEKSTTVIGDALAAAIARRGQSVVRLEPAPQEAEPWRDVTLLYNAVGGAILQATYTNQFPRKLARFDYSLGDLAPLLEPRGADAILFAFGTANISSAGRSALQVLGALVGPGYSVGIDRIFLGLVDRSGAVLWFDTFASTGYDLRDPESAAQFVQNVTDHLPEVKRSAPAEGGKP